MGKIIVFGDVNGQFSDAFTKLAKLHAKQSFSFALLIGNLFRDPATATETELEDEKEQLAKLLKGEIEVPLTTYFALGNRALPSAVIEKLTSDQGELCPNLFILGRKVSIKTSDGFKLVAIGGAYNPSPDDEMIEYAATYGDKDVESAKEFGEADILITSDWPAGVLTGSRIGYPKPPSNVSSLGDLVTAIKPRYHFSISDPSYEREPFFHIGPTPPPVTRFISLAPLNNERKSKDKMAFSLEPSAPPPQRIEDCTASPFMAKKRKLESQQDSFDSFRYANGNGGGYQDREYRRGKRHRGNHHNSQPRQCFFCLANRDVETHMITSIGEEAYMAVAKGPLSNAKTFPSLQNPCNVLIIPMEHAPTWSAIKSEESRAKTKAEMQRYRDALHSLISAKSSTGDDGEAQLGAVTWEINRDSGVHIVWQFLPMPVHFINNNTIEAAFDVQAENEKYSKFAKTEQEIAEVEQGDYFKAMIWSESKQKEIVLPLPKGMRFDLQFGRRVLGKLLGIEHRAHWKDCEQTKEQETADAEDFKEIFKRYDFTLTDD